MGLIKITGTKHLVDLKADVRLSVAPPSLSIYHPAQSYFRSLALGLLGVTALWTGETENAIREAAAALADTDDAEWTQEDARQILAAVGTVPAPSHIRLTG